MAMTLEGSCHCGLVRFRVESAHPVPYQRCYCTICRKTGGGGGFLINISAAADTLEVEGREHSRVYRAWTERDGERVQSKHERHFCGECGSPLWAWHPNWPQLLHPVAGAIDTPLPPAPEHVHMMTGLDSRAAWVPVQAAEGEAVFEGYPKEAIADWHESRGLAL